MFTANLRKITPTSLATSGLLLLVLTAIAANSARLPLIGFMETRLHDLRVAAFAPKSEEHPGIAILAYDEETLALSRQRSPLDRGILARVLQQVDKAGAVAIGIDILLDQADDPIKDQLLLDTLINMQTPVMLAYASSQPEDGSLRHWQEQHLGKLFDSLNNTQVQPARIALRFEADGTIRRTPALPADGPQPIAWALARLAENSSYRSQENIDFRRGLDGRGWPFLTLPIHILDQAEGPVATMLASVLTDRIVLIGAMLDGIDQHSTPLEFIDNQRMAGVGIHAHILAQLLDGRHPWKANPWQLWLIAALAVITGLTFGLLSINIVLRVTLTIALLVLTWGAAIALQYFPPTTGSAVPLAGATISGMFAYVIGNLLARAVVSEERRFIRDALRKYVPTAVAAELERHPEKLQIGGARVKITVLFTDIAGFTSLCEQLEPEVMSDHLNSYLEGMTGIIHAAGGTLDKYIGDAVVAFWGAPLPCDDAEQRAIACSLKLDHFASSFSIRLNELGVPFGHTRIGVHTGFALVGNFGSGDRFQYTAIGDTVNTAARLEGANKYLGTHVLISEATVANPVRSSCRPMGGLLLMGREKAIDVFEAVTHMTEKDLTIMIDSMREIRQGDTFAIQQLHGLVATYPNDITLKSLVRRIEDNNGSTVFKLVDK